MCIRDRLSAKVPPVFVVKLLSAELLPMAAAKVVAPVLLTVNDLADTLVSVLIVPPKLAAPAPVVTETSSVNTKGALPKVTAAFVVLICPAALIRLGAEAVNPPVKTNASAAASPSVNVPVWLNTAPLLTVVCAPKSSRL